VDAGLLIIALEVAALVVLWVGFSTWQRDRNAPGGQLFAMLSFAVVVWCLGDAMGLQGTLSPQSQARVSYAGITWVPALWVGVAAHAARLPLIRRVPWLPVALAAPSACFYAMLYLGPWSEMFVTMDGDATSEGPLFYIWVSYSYALVGVGSVLFLSGIRSWPAPGRTSRVVALIFGISIPVAGNAIYLFAGLPMPSDPTPVLIGLAILPIRTAIYGSGILDVLPLHQRNLFDQLPVGIVLADGSGAIVQLNSAADRLLGLSGDYALGRTLDLVLSSRARRLVIRRSAFALDDDERMQAVVLMRVER
jgi:PAS domain-containing protein